MTMLNLDDVPALPAGGLAVRNRNDPGDAHGAHGGWVALDADLTHVLAVRTNESWILVRAALERSSFDIDLANVRTRARVALEAEIALDDYIAGGNVDVVTAAMRIAPEGPGAFGRLDPARLRDLLTLLFKDPRRSS